MILNPQKWNSPPNKTTTKEEEDDTLTLERGEGRDSDGWSAKMPAFSQVPGWPEREIFLGGV